MIGSAAADSSLPSAPSAAVPHAFIAGSSRSQYQALSCARANGKAICAMILAAALAQTSSGAEQSEVHFNHTVIATTGTAAPAGGNYLRFLDIVMNSRGEVAFDTSLRGTSTTGVFLGSDETTRVIALGGNNPTAQSFSGVVSNPFITSRGDVIFNLSSNVDSSTTIFRSDDANLVQLVRDGDPAPGGGNLTFNFGMGVNSRGVIAYNASVSGAAATQGVFRTDRSGTVAIATDATPLPTGGTMTALAHDPSVNDRGEVAFAAEIDNQAAFGVFRGDGKHLTTIFASGQSASGVTLTDFSGPVINERGQVLAACNTRDASGASVDGLFVGDGKRTVAIALLGQPAPKGGTYARRFGAPPVLTDRGQVAFGTALTGGTSASGIFRGDGASTTTIALQGTVAPGTNGAIFQGLSDPVMDEDGRVAFKATLTPGVGDADGSNNTGIWMGTSDTDLHLVARTGQLIAGNTLVQIPLVASLKERALAWIGTFSGGASSIVVSDIHDDRR